MLIQEFDAMKKKRNYSRFYAIAKTKGIDLDQYKEELVAQFTGGRTSSLREMSQQEYEQMCSCLQTGKRIDEDERAYRERLRKARSAALNRMQRMGVDTTDFDRVNRFCENPRIAGKPFGLMSIEELQALVSKLEAIMRKQKQETAKTVVPIRIMIRNNQIPS